MTAYLAQENLRKRRDRGEPVREITRTYNISHRAISRLTD